MIEKFFSIIERLKESARNNALQDFVDHCGIKAINLLFSSYKGVLSTIEFRNKRGMLHVLAEKFERVDINYAKRLISEGMDINKSDQIGLY